MIQGRRIVATGIFSLLVGSLLYVVGRPDGAWAHALPSYLFTAGFAFLSIGLLAPSRRNRWLLIAWWLALAGGLEVLQHPVFADTLPWLITGGVFDYADLVACALGGATALLATKPGGTAASPDRSWLLLPVSGVAVAFALATPAPLPSVAIVQFEATPTHLCIDSDLTVAWTVEPYAASENDPLEIVVEASPVDGVEPSLPPTNVGATGTRTFTLRQPTDLLMEADVTGDDAGPPDFRRIELMPVEQSVLTFTAAGTCASGEVVWELDITTDLAAPEILAGPVQVSSASVVTHAGTTTTVESTTYSSAFADLPLVGMWTFESPAGDEVACTSTDDNLPELAVYVVPTCSMSP